MKIWKEKTYRICFIAQICDENTLNNILAYFLKYWMSVEQWVVTTSVKNKLEEK